MKPIYIIVIILLTSIGYAFSFANQRSRCLSELEHTANATTSNLVQQVQRSSDFINLMAEYGCHYLDDNRTSTSPLAARLANNSNNTIYSLDALEDVASKRQIGNLTGKSPVPAGIQARQNLALALSFNPYFAHFYDTLPGITYIYYTGEEHFISIYPFLPSLQFAFSDGLYQKAFYSVAAPEQNPSRKAVWTPVYLDETGKGPMVSISKPVYQGDNFRGVVSLDFTLSTLSRFLASEYRSFIFNEYGEILAANFNTDALRDQVQTLASFLALNNPDEAEMFNKYPANTITEFRGAIYCITPILDSSWKIVHFINRNQVHFTALVYSIPALIGGILFLLATTAYIRSHHIQKRLRKTVLELEASHRELEYARAAMEWAAEIDFLTETLNRRSMTRYMSDEVSRALRYGGTFSLIMGDIDHFKAVNDLYGHSTGDQVLADVAAHIQKQLRKTDLFARWGGEEFLIMLPEAGLDQAGLSAEKLRSGVGSLSIRTSQDIDISVTMSFGVAQFNKLRGLDWTIIQADNALYQAKHSGRNCVKKAEPDEDAILAGRLEWNPRWSSGNDTIDNQHKTLVDQLNDLQEKVNNRSGKEEIAVLLNEMLAGLRQHFSDEEFFLEKSKYPDLETHRQEHVNLAKISQQIREDFEAGNIPGEEVVPLIINNILINHLLAHDTRYFAHFLENGRTPAADPAGSPPGNDSRG